MQYNKIINDEIKEEIADNSSILTMELDNKNTVAKWLTEIDKNVATIVNQNNTNMDTYYRYVDNKISDLKDDVGTNESIDLKIKNAVDTLNSKIDNINSDYSDIKSDYVNSTLLESKINELSTSIKGDIRVLSTKIDNLDVNNLESKILEVNNEINIINNKITQLNQFKSEVLNIDNVTSVIDDKIKPLQILSNENQNDISLLKKQQIKSNDVVNILNQQLEPLINEVDDINKKAITSEMASNLIDTKTSDIRDNISKINTNISTLQSYHNATLPRVNDLDGLSTSGIYSFSSWATGRPCDYGTVIHMQWENDCFAQIVMSVSSPAMYVRYKNNGEPSSWRQW